MMADSTCKFISVYTYAVILAHIDFHCSTCELEFQHKSKYERHIATVGHRRRAILLSFGSGDGQSEYNIGDIDKMETQVCTFIAVYIF